MPTIYIISFQVAAMARKHILIVLVLFLCRCQGDGSFSHLVLLDGLPSVFDTNSTPEIVIRTNYSVSTCSLEDLN